MFYFFRTSRNQTKSKLMKFLPQCGKVAVCLSEIERPHVKFCWFQQWHTISTQLKTDLFFTWCNWVILLSLIKYTFLDIAVILVIHHLYLTCLSFQERVDNLSFPKHRVLKKKANKCHNRLDYIGDVSYINRNTRNIGVSLLYTHILKFLYLKK